MKVVLALFVVCLGNVLFGSVWKDAVDGRWADTEKWDSGLPTSSSDVVLPLFGSSYKVSYGEEDAGVSGTVQSLQVSDKGNVAENGRTVSFEITNATLRLPNAQNSGLKIYRHGKIRIGTGGKLSVTASSDVTSQAVMLNYRGALLHIDGGKFELDGNSYFCNCNGWSSTISQEPPELRISSGEFNITRTTGGYCYYGYGYGKCTMTGGTMNLTNVGYYRESLMFYSDSVGLDMSGDSVINVDKGRVVFGRGTFNIGGNAKLNLIGQSTRFYLGETDSPGVKATLNLMDDSSVNMSDTYEVQIGTGNKDRYSECFLNITGGNHKFGCMNFWGTGPNTTTVSISGGATLKIPHGGISVGSPYVNTDFESKEYGSYPTGIVSVVDGVLSVEYSSGNSWGREYMMGFILGNGTVSRDSDAWYVGCLDVSGSSVVTNGNGPFVVGIGLGEGRVTQSGGTIYSTGQYGRSGADGGPRGFYEAKPMVIGSFGAKGDYAMSDGESTFTASVFIGGIESNKFFRTFRLPPLEYRHQTAVGTLCVTGGTFRTKGGMYLGRDGTGILHVGGNGKVVVDDELVLSNALKSVVKVFPRTDGSAPVAVGGELVISDGAELEIDVGSIPEGVYGDFSLITCKTVTGAFDPSKVSIKPERANARLMMRNTADGIEFVYHKPRGLVVVCR